MHQDLATPWQARAATEPGDGQSQPEHRPLGTRKLAIAPVVGCLAAGLVSFPRAMVSCHFCRRELTGASALDIWQLADRASTGWRVLGQLYDDTTATTATNGWYWVSYGHFRRVLGQLRPLSAGNGSAMTTNGGYWVIYAATVGGYCCRVRPLSAGTVDQVITSIGSGYQQRTTSDDV